MRLEITSHRRRGRCFNWGGQEVIRMSEFRNHDDY